MSDFVDAYAVLGVAPGADQEAVKRAHRALVRRHHPDLAAPEERDAATRRVQDINVAYGLVRDPSARQRYDRVRTMQRARARAAAPARHTSKAVRDADRTAAAQWEALLTVAGRWSARWWRRHRISILGGARRVRRAGTDVLGRILWLVSCGLYLGGGLAVTGAAARLAEVHGPSTTLLGAMVGLVVGHRRGWRRRLRMGGIPPEAAHRLRGYAELAAAGGVIAGGLAVALLLR
jgi:hypothetical protein